MSFRSILAALRSAHSRPQARRSGRPRRTVLAVDALEDRAVPSTFTVLNLADSGAGSLRAAVEKIGDELFTIVHQPEGADSLTH